MDEIEVGKFRLTAAGLAKIMKHTGESEADVRAAAEQQGFEVEDLPQPPTTGMYL